jgi:hypothetical protein
MRTTSTLLLFLSILSCSTLIQAQQNQVTDASDRTGSAGVIITTEDPVSTIAENKSQHTAKSAMLNCTDKLNFMGNTLVTSAAIGGGAQASDNFKRKAVFMRIPDYMGSVIGVELQASTWSQTGSNLMIGIWNVAGGGGPTGAPISTVNAAISGTTPATYNVTFPSPVTVTNPMGFFIGAWSVLDSDSTWIGLTAPQSGSMGLLYVTLYNNSTMTYTSWVQNSSLNRYALIRPVVTTSVDPLWVSAQTSTGCGAPAVFQFTNQTAAVPSYWNGPFVSPPGAHSWGTVNYGDGNPAVTFSTVLTHTYTSLGNFNATFSKTYMGWTNNCTETKTINISVNNPLPAFSYTVNGFTISVTNLSSSTLTSFVWNYGDLSTSTQQNPQPYVYTVPGTYVVELEAMAPCGKVRYSVSVVVPSNGSGGGTGVAESESAQAIKIFPNPASQLITISNSGAQLRPNLEIYNALGAVVKVVKAEKVSTGEFSIRIDELPNGLYFIKFSNQQGDLVKSFIKQ